MRQIWRLYSLNNFEAISMWQAGLWVWPHQLFENHRVVSGLSLGICSPKAQLFERFGAISNTGLLHTDRQRDRRTDPHRRKHYVRRLLHSLGEYNKKLSCRCDSRSYCMLHAAVWSAKILITLWFLSLSSQRLELWYRCIIRTKPAIQRGVHKLLEDDQTGFSYKFRHTNGWYAIHSSG